MQKNKLIRSKYSLILFATIAIIIFVFFLALINNKQGKPLLSGQMEKFVYSQNKINSLDIFWFDLAGTKIKLNEQNGRLVLMNFWASWCRPCIRELPSIDKLSAGLENSKFKSLVINIDKRNKENSIRMFEDLGLENLEYLYDSQGYLTSLLKIDVIPTTIIFNKNGNEIGRLIGEANWNSKDVQRFLKFFIE